MKNNEIIFQKGSRTFYTASLFFPKAVRQRVTRLYAFVRVADDLVDQQPQDKTGFEIFKKQTASAFGTRSTSPEIISDFVLLCQECNIQKEWVDAFLAAMEQDLSKNTYQTYRELEGYMYGSAEVIGLMMARILGLPKKAEEAARLQGKAMQLINFLRDINEDIALGRQYIPQEDLERFHISKLTPQVDPFVFKKLINFEIERYMKLQREAESGYIHIPRSSRVPIATAAAIYNWTAKEIQKNPMIVFKRKIKPSKLRIIYEYIQQFFIL